ncbi:MAG: TonB-dependent receptor [Chitinophagaceae bacterium]|nr:TonB-dependent receptor [Chitinophagaceae bacterium]
MKRLTLLLFCIVLFAIEATAQLTTIKGIVTDTAEKKPLPNSVVALLTSKDSVFVTHTRSTKDGSFELKGIPTGSYFLLITYPTFADYYTNINVKDENPIVLNSIPMTLRSQLLQEVVVRQQLGAVRIKKDTTEYVADSFKVAANANVEELLKRLPGVQVDKDGKIKAQGEEVKKVLVDGEEFFGDDPTMATQNLRADAIDKVQVYDKKSDQAAFTGIDDGQKTKTINLKMKEDKKNGYFGKVSLGGGLKDKYNNQAMVNAFKGKRKFAAFATMANNGRTGLGWGDQSAYGGSDNSNIEFVDGGVSITSYGDDFGGGGSFYGEGLPSSWTAGVHYSNKYDEDKHKLNFSYRFNKLNTNGSGGTTSQYILPDTFYFRNDNGNNFSQKLRNSLNGTYEIQLDSSSSLKVTANGSKGTSQNKAFNYSESLTDKNAFVNRSFRTTSSNGTNEAFNSSILWRKKFKKVGRTVSLSFDQKYSSSSTDGFLNSDNQYYDGAGSLIRKDSIDQQKINNSSQRFVSGKVSYTEPLSKTVFLEFNYSLGNSNSESERITNEKKNGKYDQYIDSLSSDYGFKVLTQSVGGNIRWNKKKFNASMGGNISNSDFRQTDLIQDTVYKYNYLNFFPRANFNYNIKPQTRLGLRYNGSTQQPTIDQIQPLKDNNDPLNVRKGNPNLKQEFRHNFSLSYNDFKILNNRGIWAYIDFTSTQNAISNSDFVDTLGRRVTQPVNVNGNYNYYSYFNYGFKLKKSDFNIGFNAGINGSQYNTVVNNLKNRSTSGSYSLGVNGNYRKEKKMEFNIGIDRGYNTSKASINTNLNNNYWNTSVNASATYYLPKKFEISSNVDANFRQKTPLFQQNRNVTRWNASLSKKFLKDESFVMKFEVNDILDQNIGFSRDISSNNITERTYQTLRRFWLVSFTWNFNKGGKAPRSPFE